MLEIDILYCKIVESWLSVNDGSDSWYRDFLGKLLTGSIISFEQDFDQVLAKTVSFYDVARSDENFYHGFMLCLTVNLRSENMK